MASFRKKGARHAPLRRRALIPPPTALLYGRLAAAKRSFDFAQDDEKKKSFAKLGMTKRTKRMTTIRPI
jgi:hypothetical protein